MAILLQRSTTTCPFVGQQPTASRRYYGPNLGDTNVFVSALINRAGFPARVMAAFAVGRFTLVTSEPLLEELAVKLCLPRIRRRTGLTPEQVADLIDAMRELAEVVEVTGEVKLCRDPDDDRVIDRRPHAGALADRTAGGAASRAWQPGAHAVPLPEDQPPAGLPGLSPPSHP